MQSQQDCTCNKEQRQLVSRLACVSTTHLRNQSSKLCHQDDMMCDTDFYQAPLVLKPTQTPPNVQAATCQPLIHSRCCTSLGASADVKVCSTQLVDVWDTRRVAGYKEPGADSVRCQMPSQIHSVQASVSCERGKWHLNKALVTQQQGSINQVLVSILPYLACGIEQSESITIHLSIKIASSCCSTYLCYMQHMPAGAARARPPREHVPC